MNHNQEIDQDLADASSERKYARELGMSGLGENTAPQPVSACLNPALVLSG